MPSSQRRSAAPRECLSCPVLAVPPSGWTTCLRWTHEHHRPARRDPRLPQQSRRARITPEQAGLPAYGGNRRVKGLRREEVAMLAGVSVDYYVRMERGSLAGASESVLDALADALQLDEAERTHLFALARESGARSTRRKRTAAGQRPAGNPAGARRHDRRPRLGAQRPARHRGDEPAGPGALLPRARRPPPPGQHHPLRLPRTPSSRGVLRRLRRIANDAAAMLRLEAGRNPHDKALIELVGELSTRSPSSSASAGRPRTCSSTAAARSGCAIPSSGSSTSTSSRWSSPPSPGSSSTSTPPRGHPTADALKLLASWAASQEDLPTEAVRS